MPAKSDDAQRTRRRAGCARRPVTSTAKQEREDRGDSVHGPMINGTIARSTFFVSLPPSCISLRRWAVAAAAGTCACSTKMAGRSSIRFCRSSPNCGTAIASATRSSSIRASEDRHPAQRRDGPRSKGRRYTLAAPSRSRSPPVYCFGAGAVAGACVLVSQRCLVPTSVFLNASRAPLRIL